MMVDALRKHWPEYLMEAALLAAFMISACIFGALLEHEWRTLAWAKPRFFSFRMASVCCG
jgi:hypothetical protein